MRDRMVRMTVAVLVKLNLGELEMIIVKGCYSTGSSLGRSRRS